MGDEYECPVCEMKQVEVVESTSEEDSCRCLLCGHEWGEYKRLDEEPFQ